MHQNQENRIGDDREMKKEEEVEHTHMGITPGEESMKENSSLLNPSPISTFDPVLVYVSLFVFKFINCHGFLS